MKCSYSCKNRSNTEHVYEANTTQPIPKMCNLVNELDKHYIIVSVVGKLKKHFSYEPQIPSRAQSKIQSTCLATKPSIADNICRRWPK